MTQAATPAPLRARQLAVSAVDGKLVLEQGVIKVINGGERDGAMVYDLAVFPPREIGYLPMPTSLAGPPQSVAVSPDQNLAVVTAAQRTDAADASRTVPDTRITVIDLAASPARIVQALDAGLGPTGVSFSPDGTLVVVANRNDGTLSVFRVTRGGLEKTETVRIGDAQCQPASTAFTPDGAHLLVTRDGDHFVSVFDVIGEQINASGRDITAGIKPYGLAIAPNGQFAVTANVGRVSGDADSISVIDLRTKPFRVIDTHGVAATPEAVVISPDGRWVVAVCHNGSTRVESSPLYNPHGTLVVFRVDGMALLRHSTHAIGRWAQGAVFSHDSATLLVQNTVERELQVFCVGQDQISDSGHRLPIPFGSFAAIRTADFPHL
jgi:DNA-binding beta-propeller fold protein YncE